MGRPHLPDPLFGIDVRSLAAFRIGIGIAVLADLATRAGAIAQHYSDSGVLSREAWERLVMGSDWQWSVHFQTGTVAGQWALFALAALAAVSLAAGYRTRLAAVACWAMVVSLQARNPLVLYGADQLLRLLLFWGMFLALGSAWSLDRRRKGDTAAAATRLCSTATAALLLQPCVMYFFSGLLKRNDSWETGNALAHALAADMYVTGTGRWLAGFPGVVDVLGHTVPWLEMLAPLLLFVPWRTRDFRIAGLMLLVGFHAALASCLVTGLFPLVALVGLAPFVPGEFWDRVGLGTREITAAAESLPATPLSRAAGLAAQVLVALLFSYAIAWNVAGLKIEEYSAGQATAWMREWWDKGRKGLPLSFRDYAVERRMGSCGWIGRVTAMHQRWDMFFRVGPEMRGWPVIVGTLEDGRTVSVLEDGRVFEPGSGQSRPDDCSTFYPGTRWLVYFTSLRMSGMRAEREILASVIARDWQGRHPEMPLARLRIVFAQEAGTDAAAAPKTEVWYDGPVRTGPDPADHRAGRAGAVRRGGSGIARGEFNRMDGQGPAVRSEGSRVRRRADALLVPTFGPGSLLPCDLVLASTTDRS